MSTELRRLRNYIDGEFRDAADGRTTEVVNPVTGEAYATAPLSGQADVDAAMAAAAAAFPGWRDVTPAERQKALLKIADAFEERAEELIAAEVENTGKPIGLTRSRRSRRWSTRSASSPARRGCWRGGRPVSTWRV